MLQNISKHVMLTIIFTISAMAIRPGAIAAQAKSSDVELTVNADEALHQVSPLVYGQFLEHIYHSVNGGLWGDLIWNRSFELETVGEGVWSIAGDVLDQSSLSSDIHLEFGDTEWTDYEVTLEARRVGGAEGFVVVFRAKDSENHYWLNIGGWNNTVHAIEKRVNGPKVVLNDVQVPGSVNTGQWYKVRLRCEGNHIQVWLGDEKVLDQTDNDNPFLKGMIGLGSWSTHAQFRNLKVTDLSGTKVLYTGLPAIPKETFRMVNWLFFGDGSAARVEDALNNDYAVQLSSAGGIVGLKQANLNFSKQKYTGSLWLKGSTSKKLKIEFLDGDDAVIGAASIPKPTAEWKSYAFKIKPRKSTESGSFRIVLQGAGKVLIDQVSMLGQDAIDAGGYRPDLLEAVSALRPPIIRWPGGCFASLYLWKDGVGPQHQRRKYAADMWNDQDVNSYGTDEHLALCEKLDIEPLIVINTGLLDAACGGVAQFKLDSPDDYLPYALDWMEYCNGDASTKWGAIRAQNGRPEPYNVKYWEIDNETWSAGAPTYIAKVKEFVPAMRKKAEELGTPIVILVCGGSSYDMNWNRQIIDGCADLMDYISVHHYEDASNFASGVPRYENFLIELKQYIARSANPELRIYNSEWNAQTTDWRTGLYAGGLLNAYERQGDYFQIGGPALFLRHTSANAWDNAFINFDHTGWFPAPNYVVMKLWRDHYAPNFLAINGDQRGCNIVATRGADDTMLYLKAVNPTAEAKNVRVRLAGSDQPSAAELQLVAPGELSARNTIAEPKLVRPASAAAELQEQTIRFALPRYSAGVVSVRMAKSVADE